MHPMAQLRAQLPIDDEEVEDDQEYPSSDGEPLAENTEQYKWIVRFAENLDYLRTDDFVGADNFWYPRKGHPEIRVAPDAYVAFGRPKGPRRSYKQWEEDNVIPAVVVEVWCPKNSLAHQRGKLAWYDRYGVQEFWTWDPDRKRLVVFERGASGSLELVVTREGWTSPLTGVWMREQGGKLTVIGPDGFVFRSGDELRVLLEERTVAERAARSGAEAARAEAASAKREMRVAKAQTEAAKAQTEAAKAQTEAAKAQVAVANERAERLAAKLRELGIEPE